MDSERVLSLSGFVYQLALRYQCGYLDVDDMAQELMIELISIEETYDGSTPWPAYAIGLLKLRVINVFRRLGPYRRGGVMRYSVPIGGDAFAAISRTSVEHRRPESSVDREDVRESVFARGRYFEWVWRYAEGETLLEIAERAGVSQSTTSRVVNGEQGRVILRVIAGMMGESKVRRSACGPRKAANPSNVR